MSEAYICDAARTQIDRLGGSLATIRPDDLAAIPFRALAQRNPSPERHASSDCREHFRPI